MVYGFKPDYVAEKYKGKKGPWWNRRNWYISTEEQHYISKKLKKEFVIPAGFEYERFSVPPVIRWFVRDSLPGSNPAAKLHDMLCNTKGKYDGQQYSRKQVDELFKEAMESLGTPWYKRWTRYTGVRAYDLVARTW